MDEPPWKERSDPGSGDKRDWAQEEGGDGGFLGTPSQPGEVERALGGQVGVPCARPVGPGQALGGQLGLAPHGPGQCLSLVSVRRLLSGN